MDERDAVDVIYLDLNLEKRRLRGTLSRCPIPTRLSEKWSHMGSVETHSRRMSGNGDKLEQGKWQLDIRKKIFL